MGIGDLSILISNIHAISKKNWQTGYCFGSKKILVLKIKYCNMTHLTEIIELDEKEIKGFFNIIKKIKPKNLTSHIFLVDKTLFNHKNVWY